MFEEMSADKGTITGVFEELSADKRTITGVFLEISAGKRPIITHIDPGASHRARYPSRHATEP